MDMFMMAAIEEAERGIPRIVIGENVTFLGEEALLRERGVQLTVLQDERCIALMRRFISERPELWYEDIGTTGTRADTP